MTRLILGLDILIYKLILRAFPVRFRSEFEQEMMVVFTDSLVQAQNQSSWQLMKVSLLELYRMPLILLRIHWMYLVREQRRANRSPAFAKGTATSLSERRKTDGRHSWKEAIFETGFFIFAGAAMIVLTYLRPDFVQPGWYRQMNILAVFLLLISFPSLVIGLARSQLRYCAPPLGLLLGYCYVAASQSNLTLLLPVTLLALLLLTVMAVVINELIRPIPGKFQGIGSGFIADWTVLSFGFYGLIPLIIILAYDDSHLNNQTPLLALSVLFMILGALFYSRSRQREREIFALLAGLTLSMLPALLDMAHNMGGLVSSTAPAGAYLAGIGWLLQMWLFMIGLLLSPLLIGLTQKVLRQEGAI
jgi:hypothetical protein